ncbi:hypothetical protein RRG08_059208 [Elysia crispata]|uniref:Ig-like domain-containing protein n=1 Tax=Elysia crispata TaxID=231223 RepID=A0AAE1DEM6_9GAST|nr:hypothetical protein RRG08_059208 [Elysia crispata]
MYICLASDDGPLCFDCSRLKNPYACKTIKQCPKGFKCFSTYYWEPQSGDLYWDQGCKSDSFCSALPPQRTQVLLDPDSVFATVQQRGPVPRAKRFVSADDDPLRFCMSCCRDYSDYCNMLPCDHTAGSGPGQVPSGLVCLSCSGIPDPANCTNTERCAANQKCAVWSQANGMFGKGCKDDTLCQAQGNYITFGKRNTDVETVNVDKLSTPSDFTELTNIARRGTECRACCKDNFCNSLYCSTLNDLPIGVTTVATTKPPTTTPTSTTTPLITTSTSTTTTAPVTPLSVTLQPKQLSVLSGSNASFNCRVKGQPPINAIFTIVDSQNRPFPLPLCATSIVTDQEDVICDILTSQRPHGRYQVQCVAHSNQGNTVESAILEVRELTVPLSVDIHPSDTTIFPGTPASIYCRVNGSPKVSYTWIDSSTGKDVTNNSNFRTYVTANNTAVLDIMAQVSNIQAVFVCQAYNALDSVYLPFNVNTFTNITLIQGPQDITLTYGNSLPGRMSCKFESWPPANVSWFFETEMNTTIAVNESQIDTNYTGPAVASEINILPDIVKQMDIKSASCEANNGFATKSASADINLLVAAQILTPARSYTVQAGSSFSLYCEAEGSPEPQMAWTFTDEFGINKILIGANVERKGAAQSLQIDHIYDSETFTRYAKNNLKTVTAAFDVTVV